MRSNKLNWYGRRKLIVMLLVWDKDRYLLTAFLAVHLLLNILWSASVVVFHQLGIVQFTILQHIFVQSPIMMLLLNLGYSNWLVRFCLLICQPIVWTARLTLTLLQGGFGIPIKELILMWESSIHSLSFTARFHFAHVIHVRETRWKKKELWGENYLRWTWIIHLFYIHNS